MKKKTYEKITSLTAEQTKLLPVYRDEWIANAMKVGRMTREERTAAVKAAFGLYEAANLPAPKAVVIVPSPMVVALAGGAADAWWRNKKYATTYAATAAATRRATRSATRDATYSATYNATHPDTYNATAAATQGATYAATDAATDNATDFATRDATDDATDDATYTATHAATNDATDVAMADATRNATRLATYNATYNATDNATNDATYNATYNATHHATDVAMADATNHATYNAAADATRNATYTATRNAADATTHAATYAATHPDTYNATRNTTRNTTYAATYSATNYATLNTTYAATYSATNYATYDAMYDATDAAARAYTYSATYNATDVATYGATDVADAATDDATYDATDHRNGINYAADWERACQGGSEWSGSCAFLAFWRDAMGLGQRPELRDTYAKYAHWETLAKISGYRWMSQHFCMISERPIKLSTYVDGRGRYVAHCEDGPSHLWADGSCIYHVHGVKVDAWIVEHPEQITIEKINSEENAEVRRIMRERYGEGRYLSETGAKLIDADFEGARKGAAPRALLEDNEGERWLVGTDGSTSRVYYMPVNKDVQTCVEAHVSICGFDERKIACKS